MKRIILLGFLALAFHTPVFAAAPAGAVVYFRSGGEVYLLMAEHARGTRGWAGFGGGGREGESLAETAAHKVEEESRGYYKRADILTKIGNQAPVMDGEFASYFVEVGFVPAQSVMNHPIPDSTDAYQERSTFAWIPYSSIEAYLQEDIDREKQYPVDPAFLPAGSGTQWYWRAWLGNMRKAVVAGKLLWK
jgi:ADP-ribose pyrophosphatase YjhB (NUDIX family)